MTAFAGALVATASGAQDTGGASPMSFVFNGQQKTISQRSQVDAGAVAAHFRLPDACDGLCIAPDVAAPGVATIGEAALLAFMATQVATGEGLVIDSRMPLDRARGYLPASVSVPHSLVTADNPYLPEILVALGARSLDGAMNFSDALELVVFDAGPTTQDAQTFIRGILAAGYPADKIRYYRGGMQVWITLGLNTEGTSS